MTSPYTAPSPGYIICSSSSNNSSLYVEINGIRITQNAGQPGDWVDSVQVQCPVYTGDTITYELGVRPVSAFFVPMS